MNSILIESTMHLNPSFPFAPARDPNLHSMLEESADRFITEFHNNAPSFSAYKSILSRILQSKTDPPLELILFYLAVTFYDSIRSNRELPCRLSAVREVLRSVSVLSAGPKSVALVAPAVSEVFRCLKETAGLSDAEKVNALREITELMEGVVSFIGVCIGRGLEKSSELLLPCFVHVLRVWGVGYSEGGDSLGVLFPLVSEEIRGRLREESCGVDYLASVVVIEAFFLVLGLKVMVGGALSPELQKELRIWIVGLITAFGSSILYEMLLKLLLNLPLPVISIVNAADENIVRDILYDAVLLTDYSFINPDETIASVFIRRLAVTHQAIHVAREKGDHERAISYANAFSTSDVLNVLLRWACLQAGLKKVDRPNATTPQAFLKWLLDLEQQGLRVFEDDTLQLRKSIHELEEPKVGSRGAAILNSTKKIADSDIFFDNGGNIAEETMHDDEEMEQIDTAFKYAACAMKSIESNGWRKRKECQTDLGVEQMKTVKYKVHATSIKHVLPALAADSMNSGSEVDDPPSDHEMEDTEQ